MGSASRICHSLASLRCLPLCVHVSWATALSPLPCITFTGHSQPAALYLLMASMFWAHLQVEYPSTPVTSLTLMKEILALSSFYRGGDRGPESLCNFSKVTQKASQRTKMWLQTVCTPLTFATVSFGKEPAEPPCDRSHHQRCADPLLLAVTCPCRRDAGLPVPAPSSGRAAMNRTFPSCLRST